MGIQSCFIDIGKKYMWKKGTQYNYRKAVHTFLNSVRMNAL